MSDFGPLQLNYLKRKRDEEGGFSYILSDSPLAKKRRVLLKNKCDARSKKAKAEAEESQLNKGGSKTIIKKNKKGSTISRLMTAFNNKDKLKLINELARKLIISDNGERRSAFSFANEIATSSIHFGESCIEWDGYSETSHNRTRPMYRIDKEYVDARKVIMVCFASKEDLKMFCQYPTRPKKEESDCATESGLIETFASRQIRPFCNNHGCVNWRHHIVEHAMKFRWYKAT
jgi:hypothetical protein